MILHIMNAKDIRTTFLEFFKSRGHEIVPSAPLVNKDDPTLMFTNAGMNQFKDYFLGTRTAPYARAADTQKCLRVSGKHNDLEEVGLDTYHHTLFEMLGNWSFGDYFKKEAIAWAWELLTGEYKLSKDRLYVTVFGGDEEDGLGPDEEALAYWSGILDKDRILYGSKKDNFWEMGDTGPCGPCSEIHIDLRPDAERQRKDGKELVNNDHPLVVEIWNLVFMEFNRQASGKLVPLPAKHVDTGMGFERLCMAIQGKSSNYDTDVFTPLIGHVTGLAGITYGQNEQKDIAVRVIVDHVRAIAFAIADGQLPSNTGAGYVIRRILRRAVRYGYTFLNFDTPFLYSLMPILVQQFQEIFPGFAEQQEFVASVIEKEEESFLNTLANGLKKLELVGQQLARERKNQLSGEAVFELYDTYGFPPDLTSLIAREKGLEVDMPGFDLAMKDQKSRSRADATRETGDWVIVHPGEESQFAGYDETSLDSRILRYRTLKQKGKDIYQMVLEKTPFYAESGGQVGDTGTLSTEKERIRVLDTRKENQLIVHLTDRLPDDPGQMFNASIDVDRREDIRRNHSATHLLHAALRQILGKHVEQRGSLVNDKVLRFDFSHFQRMNREEILEVEQEVNRRIRQDIPLTEKRSVPIGEARAMGAMALFGEKYGNEVRVIIFDPAYSVELCGGTHVPATGTIGFFKIISESSISAGIRRIEAVTGQVAEEYVSTLQDKVSRLDEVLRHPPELETAVKQLIDRRNALEKQLEELENHRVTDLRKSLADQVSREGDMNILITKVSLPSADALKKISFDLRNQFDRLFMVLAADVDGKPQIAVTISDPLLQEYQLNAGTMVRELAKNIKGGGGGQPFFATAGGKDLDGLDRVINQARHMFKELVP